MLYCLILVIRTIHAWIHELIVNKPAGKEGWLGLTLVGIPGRENSRHSLEAVPFFPPLNRIMFNWCLHYYDWVNTTHGWTMLTFPDLYNYYFYFLVFYVIITKSALKLCCRIEDLLSAWLNVSGIAKLQFFLKDILFGALPIFLLPSGLGSLHLLHSCRLTLTSMSSWDSPLHHLGTHLHTIPGLTSTPSGDSSPHHPGSISHLFPELDLRSLVHPMVLMEHILISSWQSMPRQILVLI